VHEGFDGFCGFSSLVIVMAVDAGAAGNSFVKKNLAALFRERYTGNSFYADEALFVTTDALQ
jgi:hypothetical protein